MAKVLICPSCGTKNRVGDGIRGIPLCGKCKTELAVQAKASTLVLTTDNIDAVIRENPRPLLVDFWARWYVPCQAVTSMLETFAAAHAAVDLAKVNIEEHPMIAAQYEIFSVPTLILFVGGHEVHRLSGAVSATELAAAFKPWLDKK